MTPTQWLVTHGLGAQIQISPPAVVPWEVKRGRPPGGSNVPGGARRALLLAALTRPKSSAELLIELGWSRSVLSSALETAKAAGKVRMVRYAIWERT